MNDLILLIRTSRPASIIVCSLLFLTGFYVSGADFTVQALLNLQVLILLPLIVFGINDVYDYETDKRSKRKRSFIEGYYLPKEKQPLVKKACFFSALAIILFSLTTRNATNIITTVFAVFLAYAYSAPHLRLKEKPILDSISNSLVVMVLLMLGFSYGGTFFEFPLKLIYASMGAAAVHALGALMDYTPDKKAGITTIATFFGKRFAALFATAVILSIILFSGINNFVLNAYLWLVLAASCLSFIITDEKFVRKLFMISAYAFISAVAIFLYQQFFK